MADIVPSLFGLTPEMYQQSQQARADQQALQYAQLTPFQQANFAVGRGANMLGGAIGRGLGGEDPELARITMRQQIAGRINPNDPASIKQGIEALAPNDPQGAMMLQREYQRLLESNALIRTRERERAAADPFQKLVESGKYTPASLAEYQRTGLPADLVLYEKAEKPEKPLAPNIKEIGVADKTREPVYLDVNNDQQFVFKQSPEGKQVRVPFSGGVDRTTAKTDIGVKLPEGQSEFVKRLNVKDADRVDAAIILRDNSVSTINSLNRLASLPDNELISGQFAAGRVGATSLLETLGLASPTDARRLASSEQYQKVASDVVLQTLGGKLGAGFSNDDRKFIQGLIPQLETSPAARRQLISFMQAKNQEIISETTRLENYARENNGLKGFTPKIPISVAPTQPRPYSGLTDEQLAEKIRAAQAQQRR
jgi:hypothetical protein